jgi:hypothetical protein
VAQRQTWNPPALTLGTIVSFDPDTHMAVAKIDFGGGWTWNTPPSQLMVPWHGTGDNGPYSAAGGPEEGQQCVVGILDRAGDVYVILGFTPFDPASGIGVPPGELLHKDKRTSFLHLAAQRGGMARVFGNAYASIFGTSGTEVGGENLDATEDAIVTKTYLDQALSDQVDKIQSQITSWASASLQGGSGASGPTLTAIESTGSSLARAVK